VTTAAPPSSEKSANKESTASAMRRAREESITNEALIEVRRQISELAGTMGAVSLSLVVMQKELAGQSAKGEQTSQETLAQMQAFFASARNSFDGMARTIERYPAQVDQHLARLDEESARRTREAERQRYRQKWWLYGGLLAAVIASSLSAWGGWSWQESYRKDHPTETEAFADYMVREHPQVTKKYWQLYKAEQAKSATRK
jgi:hypothetical protein